MGQKVTCLNPGWASRRLDNIINPAKSGYLSNQDKAVKGEGRTPPVIYGAPDTRVDPEVMSLQL